MNISGMDYNTQREPLIMPEYGREIQKMVDYAATLPDKRQRQVCAETIVKMMEAKTTQVREDENNKRALWDHLYMISRGKLDIDWPYDMADAERILSKPEPMSMPRKDDHVHLRHYGHLLEEAFDKLKAMPEGRERDELVRLVANQMKRDLAVWGHGSMDDERVVADLARLTDGKIQIDLKTFKFGKVDTTEAPVDTTKKCKRK